MIKDSDKNRDSHAEQHRENSDPERIPIHDYEYVPETMPTTIYSWDDLLTLQQLRTTNIIPHSSLETLDELLERDKQREEDGFHRRIKIGRIAKPSRNKKDRIIVVPTTSEPKFYHDDSITDDEQSTGGSGDGEEGDIIGEESIVPWEQAGDGNGAGEGGGGEHDVIADAFDLGRILTAKFQLPNLKPKGKKRSLTMFKYDLTDRNRGSGQLLNKKETLKNIIKTNIMLDNVEKGVIPDTTKLLINPRDHIYHVMSREKDFETQAMVFFIRDYSGSMFGKPTEVISTQHLFIYSWLMYQYKSNVETRFILHDTDVIEVDDFYTYHNSQVAGGTKIYPAYQKVLEIIEIENLIQDYNIYIFHGTDGDDWQGGEEDAIAAIKSLLNYVNRFGITVARNSWSSESETIVEKYIKSSKLPETRQDLFKIDALPAESASEARIIESIRRLVV